MGGGVGCCPGCFYIWKTSEIAENASKIDKLICIYLAFNSVKITNFHQLKKTALLTK